MTACVILYGSRARGDSSANSDVDIILSEDCGTPGTPRIVRGLSVHYYPQDWLRERASQGDLFVAHVALEGKGIFDPDGFMDQLRQNLRLKPSYADERNVAVAVVRLVISRDWGFETSLRRRYFWAIRTIGASLAAEKGGPAFSNERMEEILGVPGVALHIKRRENATFQSCKDFGREILSRNGLESAVNDDELKNLLMSRGGIAQSTVKMFEVSEAQEFAAGALYW